MQYTTNYNLNKPESSDNVNISDINGNMDIIDTELKNFNDQVDKPLEQTISISSRIHHIANTVYGQVSVDLSGITYTNIVKNSNFVNGTTDWTTGGGTISASNNILSITADGSLNFALAQNITNLKWTTDKKVFSKLLARVTNSSCTEMVIEIRDSVTGIVKAYTLNNPVENQWYELKEVATATTQTDNVAIRTYHQYTDSATANGKVMEVKQVLAVDITGDIEADTNVLANKYTFITDTKSTVLAQRLKSVGKNLFDESKVRFNVYLNSSTGEEVSYSGRLSTDFIPIEYLEGYAQGLGGVYLSRFFFYDSNKNFISVGTQSVRTEYDINTVTPVNCAYIRILFIESGDSTTNDIYDLIKDTLLVWKGTTSTTYEEYQESVSYIYAEDENGDILEAHSLPNGVKDEVSDGKLYKRVNDEVTLSGTDFESYYTGYTNIDVIVTNTNIFTDNKQWTENIDNTVNVYGMSETVTTDNANKIGKFATRSSQKIEFIVAKGAYTDLADAQANFSLTLIYQLAQRKYYDLVHSEDLYTFDGETTIMWDPAIRFEAIADQNGEITIPHTEYPINFVEKVEEKIVYKDNISYIEATYNLVDSTKIGGLVSEKKYRIAYQYPSELNVGLNMDVTYNMNTADTIVSLLDVQRRLQKELGSVWVTLLPLADKELAMYALNTISDTSVATTQELGDKINELINVWK